METAEAGVDINGPPMSELRQFRLSVEFPTVPGELRLPDWLPRFATLIGLPLSNQLNQQQQPAALVVKR